MSEAERAAYYEAHQDDPTIWGEAEPEERERVERAMGMTLTMHFTPQEAAQIRRLAQARDVSYGAVMRAALEVLAATSPDPRAPH